MAQLRRLLLKSLSASSQIKAESTEYEEEDYWRSAARGELPLVIEVSKADHIATLINIRREVNAAAGSLKLIMYVVFMLQCVVLQMGR
jgi:hypothetical protein